MKHVNDRTDANVKCRVACSGSCPRSGAREEPPNEKCYICGTNRTVMVQVGLWAWAGNGARDHAVDKRLNVRRVKAPVQVQVPGRFAPVDDAVSVAVGRVQLATISYSVQVAVGQRRVKRKER